MAMMVRRPLLRPTDRPFRRRLIVSASLALAVISRDLLVQEALIGPASVVLYPDMCPNLLGVHVRRLNAWELRAVPERDCSASSRMPKPVA